ncbi:thioesterase family protein [Streptomyces sp. NPDC096193]|uniref:acyl-CoA thioesterase n=1 Tax=Streptomyces sp. NPDC096193 TaxID=3155821 RepID=UPI003327FFE4
MSDVSQESASEYGVLRLLAVYFDDLDSFGMLHNSRYGVLAERAWVAYWQENQVAFARDWALLDDGYNVAKELHVNFDMPITRPGGYGVHLWVERVGRSSLTYGFRVCSADGATTYARGHRIVVRLDRETLKPTTWTERTQELLLRILRPEN